MHPQIVINTVQVGEMATNCYLLTDWESHKTIIIDPGDDGDCIIRIINDHKLIPIKIIATHGHFDHILAATEIRLAYNIPFMMHNDDRFLLDSMVSSAKQYLNITPDPPPQIDNLLKDRDIMTVGKSNIKIIETPGHTPGSVCLYMKKSNILISGDLIFANNGRGRTDFSYSNIDYFNKSINKIMKLSKDTKVYPGHGESFKLKYL